MRRLRKFFRQCANMQKNKLEYFLLLLILVLAFFIRIYRINDLLGFWYDQGRDALVIWDLIHKGKLFLIGPTTGIEGIFRGPWYYWLIAPFYFLGKGNPVYPSVFLSFTTVVAIGMAYFLTEKIGGKVSAFLVLIISSFSHSFVSSSRWLSNPTPMYLISMIFIASLYALNRGKKWAPPLSAFSVGLAMQFGSAAEIFYIPSLAVLLYINRKRLPKASVLIVSLLIFLVLFVPQILFDVKHEGILRNSIKKFILGDKSFRLSFWIILKTRLAFYYNLIISKFWIENKILALPSLMVAALAGFLKRKILLRNRDFGALLIVFVFPLVGMLFFQGNKANVYDYYFTGYYLVLVMIFSIFFGRLADYIAGRVVIGMFLILFLTVNAITLKNQLFIDMNSKKAIVLGNEVRAVEWIYRDAGESKFNVDIYVPPVIPYAYDYLFRWRGSVIGKFPSKELLNLLYTVYEEDDYLPSRLTGWLNRQAGIGEVIKNETFGGVTVQKRIRYEKEL